MMRYHHKLGAEETSQSESTSFLLARKAGGYLSFGLPNVTRYQGFCTLLPYNQLWELLKSVESIAIQDSPEAIILLPDSVERIYKNAMERFTVHQGAVTYDVTQYTGTVKITLDMRFIHDFEKFGRHYTIQDVPGGHVITYSCPRYSFCLAIIGAKAQFNPSWREVEYSYDKERNSMSTYSVYDCLEYQCNRSLNLRFGVGWTPAEAIQQANNTNQQQHHLRHNNQDAALQAAIADLDGVITTLPLLDLCIMAGYPWFYQVYTRDEAISTGALIRLGHVDEAKKILFRELQHMHADGRIANRFPNSEIASADAVGWTFLRLHELFNAEILTHEEQVYVQKLLSQSLQGLQHNHFDQGLVQNEWKETWMDTTGGYEDGRKGARIEIQALTLNMYCFMAKLCSRLKDSDNEYYTRKEQLLRAVVRERFFDENTGMLADGIDDHVDRTVRPNTFIAYYAYPQLFSLDEWRRIFSTCISHLWLPWGGLATIDKEHLLFTPQYTGETDKSYHRGDSWFFVNNIAALALLETGFTTNAEQLYAASKKQLLTLGIPGHAAETSSAKQLEGVGCFSQAWSAATFVELWLARVSAQVLRSSS